MVGSGTLKELLNFDTDVLKCLKKPNHTTGTCINDITSTCHKNKCQIQQPLKPVYKEVSDVDTYKVHRAKDIKLVHDIQTIGQVMFPINLFSFLRLYANIHT